MVSQTIKNYNRYFILKDYIQALNQYNILYLYNGWENWLYITITPGGPIYNSLTESK